MALHLRKLGRIAVLLPLVQLCSCFSGQFFRGPDDLISYSITPVNGSVGVGGVQQFTASGVFGDNSTGDVTGQTKWTSSDPSIATINAVGLSTGVVAGKVTITGTCQSYTLTTTLTVSSSTKTLSSIAVTPLTASIAVGSTQQYTATGSYSDGSTTVLTNGATWVSSDPGVATITSTGLATAVSAGNTVITANFGSVTGTARLTAQ